MRRINPLSWASALALVATLAAAPPARSYPVMTEKVCYQPGETVVVLGDGWYYPGETVNVTFTRYPLEDGVSPVVLQTVVDANGQFRLAEYVEPAWPTTLPEGTRYYTIVSAVGPDSGIHDDAAFGDVQIVGSVGISPAGPWRLAPGGTLSADVAICRGWAPPYAKGGFTVDLSFVADCGAAGLTGPCPFNVTLSPATLTFAPGEDCKNATLTLSSTCDMTTGVEVPYTLMARREGCGSDSAVAAGTLPLIPQPSAVDRVDFSPAGTLVLAQGGTVTSTVTLHRAPCFSGAFSADLSYVLEQQCGPQPQPVPVPDPCHFPPCPPPPPTLTGTFTPSTVEFAAGETSKTVSFTLDTPCDLSWNIGCPITVNVSNAGTPGSVLSVSLPYEIAPPPRLLGWVEVDPAGICQLEAGGRCTTQVTLHRDPGSSQAFQASLNLRTECKINPEICKKPPCPPTPQPLPIATTFSPDMLAFAEGEESKTASLIMSLPCDLTGPYAACTYWIGAEAMGTCSSEITKGVPFTPQVTLPPAPVLDKIIADRPDWYIEAGSIQRFKVDVFRKKEASGPLVVALQFSSDRPGMTATFAPETLYIGDGEVGVSNVTMRAGCELSPKYPCKVRFLAREVGAGGCGPNVSLDALMYISPHKGAPVPMLDPLPTLVAQCGIPVTSRPLAIDFCPDTVLGVTKDPLTFDKPGSYSVYWTYTDESGLSSAQKQPVTVRDTLPPVFTGPSTLVLGTRPDAKSCDLVVPEAALGMVTATDLCSGLTGLTRSGVPAGNLFPVGNTVLTYAAMDAAGNLGTFLQTVTVVDSTPPAITVVVKPAELWPPNNQLVDVRATVKVNDACDPNPTFVLSAITLICERDREEFKDAKKPDIVGAKLGTPDVEFQLRAEKGMKSCDLTYIITYTAKDQRGNTATASARVVVPHDRHGQAEIANGCGHGGDGKAATSAGLSLVIRSLVQVPVTDETVDDALGGTEREPLFIFDARNVDPAQAWMGNSAGLVAPTSVAEVDLSGDGYEDLVLNYESTALQDLLALPVTADDPMMFYYRALNGTGYEVVVPLPSEITPPAAGTIASGRSRPLAPGAGENFVPRVTQMGPGAPNPTRGTMTFMLDLSSERTTRLEVYDLRGARVRTLLQGVRPAGRHWIAWDGTDNTGRRVANGIYLVRVEAGAYRAMRKAVLVK